MEEQEEEDEVGSIGRIIKTGNRAVNFPIKF